MRRISFAEPKPDLPWPVPIPSNVLLRGNNDTLRWLMEQAARAAPGAATVAAVAGVAYAAGLLISRYAGGARSYLPAPTAPLARNTSTELAGLNQLLDV
jgi:hypothetical protein